MISVSIVCYRHSQDELCDILKQFLCLEEVARIYVINNDLSSNYEIFDTRVEVIDVKRNIGYGRGHNIGIRKSRAAGFQYHIVSNLDIIVNPDTIPMILKRANEETNFNLFGPRVFNVFGELSANPRRFPSVFDMIIRFLIPYRFRLKHNNRYELFDLDHDHDIEGGYLSGCFLVIRNAIEKIEFDERFFMYPEDIDLSRRFGPGLMVSSSKIVHLHNAESKRNVKLALVHIINMMRYFLKYSFVTPSSKQLNNFIVIRK